MTDQQQKLESRLSKASSCLIIDLSRNYCHLACLETPDLHQSRLKSSDANCVLAPPYYATRAAQVLQQHCLDMSAFATSLAYLSLQPSGLLRGEDA